MRGPRPTRGANVHSFVSSLVRSLLICSHCCHSFVRGVLSLEILSSEVTVSIRTVFALRGRVFVAGLNVSSACSACFAFAAIASRECRPPFIALRLKGAETPGGCLGRSRGALAGRATGRPATEAAFAGVMNEPVFPFPRRAESGVKPFAFAFPEEYDGECAAALAPLWTPVFDNLCVRSRNKCCTRSRLSAAVITPGGFVSVAGCVSKAGRGFDCSSGGDDLCLFSRSMISPRRASVSRPPSCAEFASTEVTAENGFFVPA